MRMPRRIWFAVGAAALLLVKLQAQTVPGVDSAAAATAAISGVVFDA